MIQDKEDNMKVVILAGGLGTRISEESDLKPKPMVEVGGRPILWHIMKIYSTFGFNEFVICLGYKGYVIKEYFSNYFLHMSDVTFDMANNKMEVHQKHADPWKVTLVDTGQKTMTGGRLKRVHEYVDGDTFCFTYGDGVANINIEKQLEFHRKTGKMATVAAIQPPGRYGILAMDEAQVSGFQEKPVDGSTWINGGFFILEPKVFDLIEGDQTTWELEPLNTLAQRNELRAYRHEGFWQAMDTLRDKTYLDQLWESGEAPWKTWP